MPQSQLKSLLCLLLFATVSGCSTGKGDGWRFTAKSLDIRRAVGFKQEKIVSPQVPTRLVSTWTDTVLHRQGQKSQRGFGGRLLFFSKKTDDPVRVEGQLVVYAFDESGRADHETQPTKRFIFPSEQFVRHESKSQVGASYSVWLPWDEMGGEQKNISLIARFEPIGGTLIVGEQTKHLLPGVQRLAASDTTPATEQVAKIRLTTYTKESNTEESKLQALAAKPAPPQSQYPQTTSISLGRKSWAQRLSAGQSSSKNASIANGQATTAALPEPAR